MQYRHVFHAGNFADVHKHIALLQLLAALRRKDKGFLFLDTHAGEGLYDLAGADARHSGESHAGIARLQQAVAAHAGPVHAAIGLYLDTLESLRAACGGARALYPGSPLLAAALLRPVDEAVCAEREPTVARALERAFARAAAALAVKPRVVGDDGYHEVRRLLPPRLRRGLVLIDPPYESADEERAVAAALTEGLQRFATGVFAVWYPIKRQGDTDRWLARVTRGITAPTLAAELCLHPPDHTAGLNGSGMLVVNPPWQFDVDTTAWQAQVLALLGGTGGSTVKWLVHE